MTRKQRSSRPPLGWALTAAVVLAAAGIAWWWVSGMMRDAPAASPTPNSPTPTLTATPVVQLSDIDGHWCPTSPADWEEVCLTIAVPTLTREGDATTLYVLPPGALTTDDPSTWDFDAEPNRGEC